MKPNRFERWLLLSACGVLLAAPVARAASGEGDELREEIRQLRAENAANRARLDELEQRLAEAPQQPATITAAPPGNRWDDLFGDDRFVVTGYGTAGFDWSREGNNSSFGAGIAPIFLYRVGDRVLFEAEPELGLTDEGTGTEVNLEYAQADLILDDYATLVAGKFLLPFGEFIQQLHPAWVNKLASNPLPYQEGEEGGLLPFSDIGAQLRGGIPLFDSEGVSLEYTAFVTNGPRYESDEDGAPLVSNNIDTNRGKGFGARLAAYPLPLARELGRLKLGASLYDGTWDDANNLWFQSWGVDLAYQLDELELRGEYLQTRRELLGAPSDQRDGWYAQVAYKLGRLDVPYLNRTELVVRYSGIVQEGLDAVLDPDTGEEIVPERPSNPRQLAFGVDYWLTPSVVGKLEYDFDFLGGMQDDQMFRAQIAVGF